MCAGFLLPEKRKAAVCAAAFADPKKETTSSMRESITRIKDKDIDERRLLLIGQLKLLLLRAQPGVRISVGSILRAAWLCAQIEGDDS